MERTVRTATGLDPTSLRFFRPEHCRERRLGRSGARRRFGCGVPVSCILPKQMNHLRVAAAMVRSSLAACGQGKTVGAPDLVIAGGGPAGLATAIRARMAGLEVSGSRCGRTPDRQGLRRGIDAGRGRGPFALSAWISRGSRPAPLAASDMWTARVQLKAGFQACRGSAYAARSSTLALRRRARAGRRRSQVGEPRSGS